MNLGKIVPSLAIAALCALVSFPMLANAYGFEIPPIALPYLSISSGFVLAILLYSFAVDISNERSKIRANSHYQQQVDALNRHAMVSITDGNGLIVDVNDKLLESTGFDPADIIGQTPKVLMPEADADLVSHIRSNLVRGLTWTGETIMICKDGRRIWTKATIVPQLDNQGQFIGAAAIRTDITAEKQAAARKDLYSTLHNLRDEVYIIDSQSLHFGYMNVAAQRRLGWSTEDYQTKSIHDDGEEFDETTFRDRIAPLLGGQVDEVCYKAPHNGTTYEFRLHLLTTEDSEKRIVCLARDISDQISAERAKAELLATISHELRTPMTSIKGAMGLLLSNAAGELPDRARDMLSIAYRNADRLLRIINGILDIEKLAAGQMEMEMNVAPIIKVIDEAVEANEQFANRFDVNVEKRDLDADVVINHDFGRTLQVLTNLLSNAAKFSPPGGKVEISMARVEKGIRISVQDFGSGIPEEAQARMFQRFSQVGPSTHRGVQGTGLGLSIAKAIMEEQGGSIGFESQEGEGSTFFVDFPEISANHNDGNENQRQTPAVG